MAPERRGAAAPDAAEDALFVDIVHEAPLSDQRHPRSVVGGTLYCILLAGYAGVAIAAPWIFVLIPDIIIPLLCSCNVLLLIVTGIFQQYWVHQVTKVGLQGYYDLSQKLKHIARIPFATIACGTALMLLILVWQPEVKILSISVLLRIALLVEVICAGCFMSLYIGHIHKYNSLNEQPDILQPLYSPLRQSSSLEELSRACDCCLCMYNYLFYFLHPVHHLKQLNAGTRLSDQQMALLQYQRENIHYLSEEVLRLQECLSKYQRTVSASTPQVDLAHLLASRDQELRALSAEMNQVHSELHLARDLIAEKDSEIQHIRSNNNQYVEESERLRAILGEWSARAAKLERALEAERVSNMELQKTRAKQRATDQGETNVGAF